MTKIFDVIPIDDYAVVVDKEAPIEEGKDIVFNEIVPWGFPSACTYSISQTNPFVNNINVFKGIHKVIGTIGKRIKGLPLIELPDEYNELLNMAAKAGGECRPNDHNHDCGCGSWVDGYETAQKKGTFSEDDMVGLLNWISEHDFNVWNRKGGWIDSEHKGYSSEDIVKEYLAIPDESKLPKRVELKLAELKRKNQINSIIPVNVFYE